VSQPVICFGQQPCGFFPKRFLYAKIVSARRLQTEVGGEIVFFYHDSDHDPRETATLLRDRHSGQKCTRNFEFENKIQRKFSPLYAKQFATGWQTKMSRQLPAYVDRELADIFAAIETRNVSEFCLRSYEQMKLLEGVRVARSSDQEFRKRACSIDDFFVDVKWENEIVRARHRDGKLLLHEGGDKFIELPPQDFDATQISPTRDTRLRWMQSVIGCTHYVHGAGEKKYLNEADAAEIKFVPRDEIADSGDAFIGE